MQLQALYLLVAYFIDGVLVGTVAGTSLTLLAIALICHILAMTLYDACGVITLNIPRLGQLLYMIGSLLTTQDAMYVGALLVATIFIVGLVIGVMIGVRIRRRIVRARIVRGSAEIS